MLADGGVKEPDEGAAPSAAVFRQGGGEDGRAAGTEGGGDGGGVVVVEVCPCRQPGEDVGGGEEEQALHAAEGGKAVDAGKVEPGGGGRLHVHRGDALAHKVGGGFVVLGEGDEIGDPLGHGSEAGVEFAAAAAEGFRGEAGGRAAHDAGEDFEEAAAYFARSGSKGFAGVPEGDGERSLVGEGLAVIVDELLYFHLHFVLSAGEVPAGYHLFGTKLGKISRRRTGGYPGGNYYLCGSNHYLGGLTMRKNFGAKPWTYPQPVFIVGTYDEEGRPDAMNAAWGGIDYDDQINLCLSAGHKTVKNLLARRAFTVSMGTEEQLVACDYVGVVSGNKEPEKFAKAGFHALRSEFVDAPLIEELPMAVECELVSYDPETCHLVGRIVNVSADERILDGNGKIDPMKLKPIVFDPVHNGYHVLGERVGNAFKDGLALTKD